MKRLLLALCLLLAPSLAQAQGPPTGPPYVFTCNQTSAYSWTTAATSTLVVGAAGKGIYICGWHGTTLSTSAGAATFQLTFTTATTTNSCLTSTPSTVLTPLNGVTSTAPDVDHPGTGMMTVPQVSTTLSPSNLCVNVGGTANLQYLLYYGQY